MNIKLQDLTIDIVKQVFADTFAQKYGQVSFPNASDSTSSIRNEQDLEYWKQRIMNGYGNVELELNPEAENWWERVIVLDPKFQANKERYINTKASYLDSERAAGRTSGLDEQMDGGDYIKFLMDKYYEYRTLAMDPTITNDAYKLYSEKAMEYYERAQEEIDKITPDATDHLSDEDKALPNVPMNELNLNRWAKLAGINEEYSSMDFDTYQVGDQIELNPKYFEAFQFPEGYIGVVKYIDKADYADETPVYTVTLKNIDPTGDENDTISVEYKQVK